MFPLLALPEYQVPLPGGARPSQNDIFILARSDIDLVTIAVEGKVKEPFGPTISEWLIKASSGKHVRLKFIQDLLELGDQPLDPDGHPKSPTHGHFKIPHLDSFKM